MKTVRLIHWNEDEGLERQRQLEALGFSAGFDAGDVMTAKPTAAKLGVKPGHTVCVVGTPKGLVDGNTVRETGLATGWVDFKVCSVDATWSALAFKRRRQAKPVVQPSSSRCQRHEMGDKGGMLRAWALSRSQKPTESGRTIARSPAA